MSLSQKDAEPPRSQGGEYMPDGDGLGATPVILAAGSNPVHQTPGQNDSFSPPHNRVRTQMAERSTCRRLDHRTSAAQWEHTAGHLGSSKGRNAAMFGGPITIACFTRPAAISASSLASHAGQAPKGGLRKTRPCQRLFNPFVSLVKYDDAFTTELALWQRLGQHQSAPSPCGRRPRFLRACKDRRQDAVDRDVVPQGGKLVRRKRGKIHDACVARLLRQTLGLGHIGLRLSTVVVCCPSWQSVSSTMSGNEQRRLSPGFPSTVDLEIVARGLCSGPHCHEPSAAKLTCLA